VFALAADSCWVAIPQFTVLISFTRTSAGANLGARLSVAGRRSASVTQSRPIVTADRCGGCLDGDLRRPWCPAHDPRRDDAMEVLGIDPVQRWLRRACWRRVWWRSLLNILVSSSESSAAICFRVQPGCDPCRSFAAGINAF